MAQPWPLEITLKKQANVLVVKFDDGLSFTLPAYRLRIESPSAEVQGHGGAKPIIHVNSDVKLVKVEGVGNYAVRLIFDDGHETGLYSWPYLYELGKKFA